LRLGGWKKKGADGGKQNHPREGWLFLAILVNPGKSASPHNNPPTQKKSQRYRVMEKFPQCHECTPGTRIDFDRWKF